MTSKDNFNKNVWPSNEDSYFLNTSEIRNSPPRAGSQGRLPTGLSDSVWDDLRAVQDTGTVFSTDVDQLRKKTEDLERKNTAMYKAMVDLRSDNLQLRKDVQILQDLILREGLSAVAVDQQGKRSSDGVSDLQAENRQQSANIATLQQSLRGLEKQLDAVQTEGVALRSELRTAKSEIESLKVQAAGAITSASEVARLLTRVDAVESKTEELTYRKVTHEHIGCDGCKMEPIVGTRYKCAVCDDYDLCHNCYKKDVHSQHNMVMLREKSHQIVGFTADLQKSFKSTAEGKLICDRSLYNNSGAYNTVTGQFLAPKTGMYFFILTVSPASGNDTDDSKAYIVQGVDPSWTKACAFGKGFSWGTGHAVLCLREGENVWLQVPEGTYSFESVNTTFSGFLIQSDLP